MTDLPPPGIDYLGGAKYPSAMIAVHPQGYAAGIFFRTFGNATQAIKGLCASGKASEIVVHLAPFDRTHRYSLRRYLPQVYKDAAKLEAIAKACGAKILISPFCEHNHSRKVMQPIFKRLREIAPSTELVNSILRGQIVAGVITEIHPEDGKPLRSAPNGAYTVSLDGYSGNGLKAYERYHTARHFRFWHHRLNGRRHFNDAIPIEQRRAYPGKQWLKSWIASLFRA